MTPLKILYVDDEPSLAHLRLLKEKGFQVIETYEPLTAEKLIMREHFDLVVSDIDFSKTEELDKITITDKQTAKFWENAINKKIPVLIQSGANPNYFVQGIKQIRKGHPKTLLEAIEQELKRNGTIKPTRKALKQLATKRHIKGPMEKLIDNLRKQGKDREANLIEAIRKINKTVSTAEKLNFSNKEIETLLKAREALKKRLSNTKKKKTKPPKPKHRRKKKKKKNITKN